MCLERLGLTPSILHQVNKRLILTRITGYGQPGKLPLLLICLAFGYILSYSNPVSNSEDDQYVDYYFRPGHDINYLAESGILWLFTGETCGRPIPPASLIADIAGGTFPAAIGIMMALYEREKTGVGKVDSPSL